MYCRTYMVGSSRAFCLHPLHTSKKPPLSCWTGHISDTFEKSDSGNYPNWSPIIRFRPCLDIIYTLISCVMISHSRFWRADILTQNGSGWGSWERGSVFHQWGRWLYWWENIRLNWLKIDDFKFDAKDFVWCPLFELTIFDMCCVHYRCAECFVKA